MEKGAPHERCFVIVCSVGGNLKENGTGKSKKLAKRQAAHRMLQTLKSMPVERDNEQSLATIDEDDLAQGIARKAAAANAQCKNFSNCYYYILNFAGFLSS